MAVAATTRRAKFIVFFPCDFCFSVWRPAFGRLLRLQDFRDPIDHVLDLDGHVVDPTMFDSAFGRLEDFQVTPRTVYGAIDHQVSLLKRDLPIVRSVRDKHGALDPLGDPALKRHRCDTLG
jgi:hypothetical protein